MRASLIVGIVDDEAPVRKALGRLLRASGYVVETFASGDEFLNSLKTHRPDCTILDLHLPGRSGLEVQQQMVQENINLPCIVITGKDEPGVRERVLASGAAAYLRKPLDEQTLLDAISSTTSECSHKESPEKPGEPTAPTDQSKIHGGAI